MDRWMDRSSYRVTWLKMQFYEFPGVLSPGLSQKILILQFAPDFWRSFRHFRCGKLAFFHVRSSLGRMIAILTHTWDVLHRNLMITWWETSYQTMNERSLPKYFCIQNRKWRKMYLTAPDRTKIFVADGINSVGDYNSPPGGCRLCVCPHFFSRFTIG